MGLEGSHSGEWFLNVQVLQLENNRLEVLPETIGDLPSLIKLDISTNSLRFLPASMVRVPHSTQQAAGTHETAVLKRCRNTQW
jgi:Leucine-rich repeat (LRR) protein